MRARWPWWQTALVAVYFLGYWAYLIGAGVSSWPRMELGQWVAYMSAQLFYALLWPAWLLL